MRAGGRRRGLALALRVGGEKGGRARDRWPQVGAVRYSRGLTRRKHSSSSIPGLRAGGPGRPAPSQTTAPGGAGWVQLLSGSRQRGEVTLKQSKCAETSRWAAASDGLRAPLRARRTSVASASRPCGPLCLGKRWLCLGGRPARAGFTAHFRLLGHRPGGPVRPTGPFPWDQAAWHQPPPSNPKPLGGAPKVEMKQPEDPINSGGRNAPFMINPSEASASSRVK